MTLSQQTNCEEPVLRLMGRLRNLPLLVGTVEGTDGLTEDCMVGCMNGCML